MRRRFSSVRARATIGATLVVAVALIAAGTAVLLSLRSNLIQEAAAQADATARQVASKVAARTAYEDLDLPDDEDRPVQVVDSRGRLLAASEELERISGTGSDAVRPDPAALREPGGGSDDEDDDGGERLEAGEISDEVERGEGSATVDGHSADYRFSAVEVENDDDRLTVWAGAPLAAEQGAVSGAQTVMLIGLPLLLVVVAGVTWGVTGRALKPVEGIRREMAAITASEDLGRRVPEPATHDEVARLARATNATLTALEASVARQRSFVADASHELRSPIASLRTQLEVGLAHPELLDVAGAVEDTVRLQALAADLLLLARLDAGERPTGGRLDLGALVREEVSQRVGDRLPVAVHGRAGLEVAGSRGQVARVLANLVDNAQRHAASRVEVRVRAEGSDAVVSVADDGGGVPAGERERIFERFVRLDDARSRDDGGAGLGLAIARDVAARHGGTLRVREGPRGGALFELRLPRLRG